MIDKTPLEQAALAVTLRPLGEIVREIGMDKPLSAWSREDVLTMVEVVIDAWQSYFLEHPPSQPENPQP